MKPILNIDALSLHQHRHGERFEAAGANVSADIGARQLGYGVTVVSPGKRAWSFHNHHANEEMFFILSGTGRLRLGAAEYPLRAGDFIAAPAGDASTAHQIINDSAEELRYLSVSTMVRPEIVEYPDSGKFSASANASTPGGSGFRQMGLRGASVDYWAGED